MTSRITLASTSNDSVQLGISGENPRAAMDTNDPVMVLNTCSVARGSSNTDRTIARAIVAHTRRAKTSDPIARAASVHAGR